MMELLAGKCRLQDMQSFVSPLPVKALRDLHWALCAPPLFTASDRAEVGVCHCGLSPADTEAAIRARLQGWARPDSPFLQQIKGQTFHRLGAYFEALLAGWLQHHPDYELLVQGEAIREGNRTVGEVDFLYWEKTSGQLIHLEVAVKYYLSQSGQSAWEDWVGPNPSDRLARKWPRMQQHQATLLRQPAGQAWLAARGLPTPEARVLIKGCFFSHAAMPGRVIPDRAYAKHIQGGWLRQHEAQTQLTRLSRHWQHLPRLAWLAPAPRLSSAEARSVEAVVAARAGRPQQWRAWPERPTQPGLRVIIVPDHWPGQRPLRARPEAAAAEPTPGDAIRPRSGSASTLDQEW